MGLSILDELQPIAEELQRHMSPHVLEHLAKEKGFVQRKSKYQAKELVALCVWLSQHVASTSLTQLCSHLEVSTGVLISPEGLNKRFNASAVQLLEQVLANLLTQRIYSTKEIIHQYTTSFRHIRILDSTTFQLPDKFSSQYQGSGGSSHTAGVKIQLEYDLLSGKFLHVYVGEGRENDKTFGSTSLQTIRPKDLYIRDLGYFDLHDLQKIHDKGAYYVSRLKLNSRIYRKNDKPEYFRNGTVKKGTLYIQLDMEELMNQLSPGKQWRFQRHTLDSIKKLPARVIIHRLTKEQTEKRLKEQAKKEKKKGITYKERSKRLSGINVYITNLSTENVPTEHIHDLYSLRWKIEILLKTWKSFFQIDRCKEIKKERLECHLYGQLISILLCSSTMFKMRQLLLGKKKKELSEYKSIYMIKNYYLMFYDGLQKGIHELLKVLLRLFYLLEKNGRKSHRYKKKTVFDILGVVYDFTMSHNHVA
ncbi:IS4 family transposase [Bacillus cereus]|uniref:IS4 family transposase n=1 Tax=Bacillus cereus TaxID=1396 RepID=UPI000BF94951|nr:IS4 family transposase [Bacillus cereus]PEQ77331.1 IS4 family transposase [Bacillus cereus]PEX26232.1 IS4 family transposase [Bacillus cereus]